MLGDIVNLLKTNGCMSVAEIAATQKIEASALTPMLTLLEQKGRIVKIDIDCNAGCSSCTCKETDNLTYYRALDTDPMS